MDGPVDNAGNQAKRPCLSCGEWFSSRHLYRHLQNSPCSKTLNQYNLPEINDELPTLQQGLFTQFLYGLDDEDIPNFVPEPSDPPRVPNDNRHDWDAESNAESGDESADESDTEADDGSDSEMDCRSDGDSDDNETGTDKLEIIIMFLSQLLLLYATLHTIPDTQMDTLLRLLAILFSSLGKFSGTCKYVASKLPTGLEQLHKISGTRSGYTKYVVCPKCQFLYNEKDCKVLIEGKWTSKDCTFVKFPNSRQKHKCGEPLLKTTVRNGRVTLTPFNQYWYQSLREVLGRFLLRPGFEDRCEQWRCRATEDGVMTDVYDGKIWKEFSDPTKHDFFTNLGSYGLMLNVDWFQPYKFVQYSVGAIYLVCLNLPIDERFKIENVILVGLIPKFGKEPSTNTFLKPLVEELLQGWTYGFTFVTHASKMVPKLFKVALLCVGCDIPAARKVCGFLGHSANIGCNKCLRNFQGRNYGGFDTNTWQKRTNADHRRKVAIVMSAKTDKSRKHREKKYGVRYSVLLELSYFDPIRMTVIDPMHNLFMGTTKRAMKMWREFNLIDDKTLRKMQEMIDKFECPADMGNIPHKIRSKFSGLTADQLKNWTILFSMYCLRDVFKVGSGHLKCWQKFVLACRCLCTKIIDGPTLQRAHLLLVQFCCSFEQLYGTKAMTINTHLHCHLQDCILDYGPIYSFWLFSFERYNGVLGRYSSNNHNIEPQLFKKFTSEVNVRGLTFNAQLEQLDSFRQEMLAGRKKRGSLLSQSKPLSSVALVSLSSSTCAILDHHWDLPLDFTDNIPGQKEYELDDEEFKYLEGMYMNLYGEIVERETDFVVYPVCRETNTLYFMGQVLGATTGRNKRSNVVGASWSDHMGHIGDGERERPGQVKRYLIHKVDIHGESKMHVLAQVKWYDNAHPLVARRTANLRPVEAWSEQTIDPGPAMFMPIQRIKYKAVTTIGTVQTKTTLFVCPRQRYLVYD